MAWLRVICCFLLLASLCVTSQGSSLVYRSEVLKDKYLSERVASDHRHERKDEKIHYFVADGRKKPYSFVNKYGVLVGFDVDIVNEVCALAKKRCYTILAEYSECIFTDRDIEYAGRGLMSQWFEGCPGYQITTERLNEFDFTLPYLNSTASFTVKQGNPKKFDPNSSDYSEFKLIQLSGAPTNAQCLKRLDKKFGAILIAHSRAEAVEAVQNGTADVLFSPRTRVPGLEVLPERVQCSEDGAGIMLRKGSDVADWWNPAFQTYYFSGAYTRLCQEAEIKYGAAPMCLEAPQFASPDLLAKLSYTPEHHKKDRLWKFVVSGRIAPYSFLDKEGRLTGFTKDMLEAVCSRAGKRCTLLLGEVDECTKRVAEYLYPGRGLMEGWFDGCTGYFNTADRFNSWDFTLPYLVSNATFKVAPGNPSGFNPSASDYSKFVIVYSATAITNDHCLNRLHKKFGKLIVAADQIESRKLLLNGTADAWFTKYNLFPDLETLPGVFHCENVGTSIMVMKGSEIPSWWNPAFESFYMTGEYHRFCEDQGKLYDTNFPCVSNL